MTDTENLNAETTSRGCIVLRIIGGLIAAIGLLGLLSTTGIRLPWAWQSGLVRSPEQPALVLGLWAVEGPAAYTWLVILSALHLLAGLQLVRLRRNGWLASLALLAYGGFSFLFTAVRLEEMLRPQFESVAGDSLTADFMMMGQQYAILRTTRLLLFTAVTFLVVFLYVASEGWRFWNKRGWYASRKVLWAKSAICAAVIGASGLWTHWGASYVHERDILLKAASEPVEITDEDFFGLSLQGRRRLTVILVRKLAEEKSSRAANVILRRDGFLDLSFLTAEDIPGIIEAAESPDVEVRDACYRYLLPDIGTPQAKKCLLKAVNGERDAAWRPAVVSLSRIRPDEAPECLFDSPVEDKRDYISLLDDFSDPRVLPVLIAALDDDDPEVREAAIDGLAKHPGMRSEQALQAALEDKKVWLRARAADSLGAIGTTDSIPVLIAVLKGPNLSYKYPFMADDPEQFLHDNMAYALQAITGRDFETDPNAWEQWWKEAGPEFDLRKNLTNRLFARLPPAPTRRPTSVEEVKADPYHKASSAQSRTLRAIRSRRNMRELAPELARYLQGPEDQMPRQFIAADILTRWGYREGIAWLIEWVDTDFGEGNRMFAIRALGPACGVNFFSDKPRWRAWWAENQLRFPSVADKSL
jgi:hypothetical protein